MPSDFCSRHLHLPALPLYHWLHYSCPVPSPPIPSLPAPPPHGHLQKALFWLDLVAKVVANLAPLPLALHFFKAFQCNYFDDPVRVTCQRVFLWGTAPCVECASVVVLCWWLLWFALPGGYPCGRERH